MNRLLPALCGLLLTGCIVFDKKSEPVTFHQFAAEAALASKQGPMVYVPRVLLPSAVRRANLVLADETGSVRVEDAHRWAAPLDRLIGENLGARIVKASGLPVSLHAPAQAHLVLLVTVDRFALSDPRQAVLTLHYRIEKSNGELLKEGSGSWSAAMDDASAPAFVRAQSNNLAKAAAAISTELVSLETRAQPSQQ